MGVSSEIKRGGRMSDEQYFGHPRNNRHHSGPFFDPPYDEYDEHGPLEDYSLNDNPRTQPMTVEQFRRWKMGRNPHGD